MPNIILEYADGQKILIKGEEKTVTRSTDTATVTKKAATRFEEAIQVVTPTLIALKNVLDKAQPDEVEVEFSLKAEGEAGFFTICSTAIGAEFKIKAVWKKENKASI